MIRIRVKGGRVIHWSKVSSVQYIGYFSIRGKGEYSVFVFEYEPGAFTSPGMIGVWDTLDAVSAAILDMYR